MASSLKRSTKSRHRETHPRGARDSAEVTLTNPACLTLTLPVRAYQELLIVLTSETRRLRQQLKQTAEDKKLINPTLTEFVSPRSSVKRKITQGERRQKQAVHKYSVKPNSVCCNCRSGKRHRLPSQFSRAHNSCVSVTDPCAMTLPAEAGNQKVNKPTPAESGEKVNKTAPAEAQPAGTVSCKNNDREMSINDRRCLHCSSTRVVTTNNCSVQTLPMTETKGINTKLKSRQTRIQLGEQGVHTKETFQRREKSTRERRPAAELKLHLSSAKQEQPVVTAELEQTAGKEIVEASTECVNTDTIRPDTIPIPASSKYRSKRTSIPQEERQCFFCRGNHILRDCVRYQQKKRRGKDDKVGQFAQTNRNKQQRSWGNEKTTQEQCVITRSITERSLLTERADKQLSKLPRANNNLQSNLAAAITTERNMVTKEPSGLTRSEPEKPPSMSTAARQEEKTVKLSTACVTGMSKTAEQTGVTAAAKTNEHSHTTRAAENEERPATRTQQKVPENSEELVSLMSARITNLLDTKEIENEVDKCVRCVFCQEQEHDYSNCKILKGMSESSKQKSEKCAMCESMHELRTCEWLKLLHSVRLLNAQSQDRVIEMYPVLKGPVIDTRGAPFYKFAWDKLYYRVTSLASK
ncbi:hypothetical protein BsWGS_12386 [Bradybaena similaris]